MAMPYGTPGAPNNWALLGIQVAYVHNNCSSLSIFLYLVHLIALAVYLLATYPHVRA